MIQDFGGGIHDDLHGVVVALEIGDEDLDVTAGNALVNRANGHREEFSAAVFAIVTIDAGDDGVFEPHQGDGLSDSARLIHIHFERRAFLDGAEAAAARAHVAENHERGGALIPALADVRTGGGFAHRVEFQLLDE